MERKQTMKKYLNKQQVLQMFREVDNSPKGDIVWKRESWNNFTDMLCKNGEISLKQYESWDNPF
jgi:hypothetical protein